MKKKLVVFIDSGDTLVDESTERIGHDGKTVEHAELRHGAADLIRTLKEEGFPVYMVADGYAQSFENVHKAHEIYDDFDGHVFSELVGVCKPDRKMFDEGLKRAGLEASDCHRVVMVGNNLERDIAGANRMNMISVLINWTDRYPKEPKNTDEIPDYIIEEPMDLLPLVRRLDEEIE